MAFAGFAGEIGIDSRPIGYFVHQQRLEERIVMVGELFEHMGPLEALALGEIGRNVLLLGWLTGAVIIGALERDIDEAGDLLAIADRDPARDQRRRAHRLERLEQGLDRSPRLIDLVDEDHVRDAKALQLPQRGFGKKGAIGVRIDDDDREVRRRDAERAIGDEADRSRRIDEDVAIAHIIEVDEVDLGRSAARPRLGACIADAASVGDRSLPAGRAGGKKKGLGEAGFPSAARPDERDGPGACSSFGHDRLLRPLPRSARRRGSASFGNRQTVPIRREVQGGTRGVRRLPRRSTSLKSAP